jgi:Ser/Thr protein kinase RdoA (MazF antagonist)
MKPYEQLTRLGRIRRLRRLAEKTLDSYQLAGAKLTFQHYEGNLVFRTDASTIHDPHYIPDPAYVPHRYNLRIHTSSNIEGIRCETIWLDALRKHTDLIVPEPLPNQSGDLFTTPSIPGVPHGKTVSLMRWVDGRVLSEGFRPSHFKAIGEVVAHMHTFAAQWKAPENFTRPEWDWYGQLGGQHFRQPIDEIIDAIPAQFKEPFIEISSKIKHVMEKLGKSSNTYGLIHSDLYPENILFKSGRAIPIDFEDCGYGYWIWDIAVALCLWPWTEEWYWMREALFDGYLRVRSLPQEQVDLLDLFMAAQYATMVLWATVFILNDPAMRAENEEWRTQDGNKLLRYFDRQ